jgi:hypothetical protein
MNVGLSDSGLLTHLSEATAGSLNGIGHSSAYEELATYSWVKLNPRIVLTCSDDEPRRRLAVNYLFMTNEGTNKHPELVLQPFDAKAERNDYEVRPHSFFAVATLRILTNVSFFFFFAFLIIQQIPWALRDLIANERVAHLFADDFANLRNAFPDWHPKTAILRDIKRKLQPIQRLNTNSFHGSRTFQTLI